MRFRICVLALITVFLLSIAACKKSAPKGEKRYELDGRVVSVDKQAAEITIDHHDIIGFMKAMTMPFKVGPNDRWALERAQPGDQISASLMVSDEEAYLTNIALTKPTSANADSTGPSTAGPDPGTAVPDLTFTNQDGHPVKLSQLRGGPVLLTFIYTRCPLPNYCIRMSNNFKDVATQLKQNSPDAWKNAHLLSISFDPEFDKPNILRQYGHSYAAAVDPDFQRWQFVTGTPEEIAKAAKFFGLVYDKDSNQYIHSLRTAVIDKDGKLVALYRGNEWKPEDVAKQIASLR